VITVVLKDGEANSSIKLQVKHIMHMAIKTLKYYFTTVRQEHGNEQCEHGM